MSTPLDRLASRHRGLAPYIRVGAAGGPAWLNGWGEAPNAPIPSVPVTLDDAPAIFRLDDWGLTHLTITLAGRASGTGGVLFYLPVGYRPAHRLVLTGWFYRFLPTTFAGSARLDVHPDGAVQARDDAWYVLLGEVSFRAVAKPAPPIIIPPSGALYPAATLYPADDLYPRT